ncbi:MAG: hypothetical protein HXS41_01535 [Theionarchaea archaeon]|nr:hypothetical protein [Theionarchaea archaeon]MBU7001517.1 hypothetical protein [Theionarchaea archaeon]MBU7019710.1 hypothetical protein [Theionarchaea archaeon]MBU7034421.1 hypothetical protein [Theionarchaea archaeon]MBU7040632.1 hypothetical protein [Theionarchaea archaeon]
MNVLAQREFEDLVIGSDEVGRVLGKIRREKRTGYLKVEFHNLHFLLFFENGVSTYGFRMMEDQLFSYSCLPDMLPMLNEGHMVFFDTHPGVLQALLDKKYGERIYGDLYTSFTNAEKFFAMLKQKTLTGCVEIDLPSAHCFILLEKGDPVQVLCSEGEEKKGEPTSLGCVLKKMLTENGVIRVFERRNPPTVLCPDLEEVFVWSDPRRLKLEFAYGQLGKEFEELLDQEMTVSQILNTLHVDFEEIADMYTYLSAKGYIASRKDVS